MIAFFQAVNCQATITQSLPDRTRYGSNGRPGAK
jgi:hypothetical protein